MCNAESGIISSICDLPPNVRMEFTIYLQKQSLRFWFLSMNKVIRVFVQFIEADSFLRISLLVHLFLYPSWQLWKPYFLWYITSWQPCNSIKFMHLMWWLCMAIGYRHVRWMKGVLRNSCSVHTYMRVWRSISWAWWTWRKSWNLSPPTVWQPSPLTDSVKCWINMKPKIFTELLC